MTAEGIGQWGPEPLLSRSGRPVRTATITIYEAGSATLATLYADQAGTTLTNPLPLGVSVGGAGLDVNGNVSFFAEPGPYVMAAVVNGVEVYRSAIAVDVDTVTAGGGGGGVSDHGALSGLFDADHPIAAVVGLQAALDAKETPAGAQAKVAAADALVVHLAGAETVTGAKTLTSPLTFDSLLGSKPSYLTGEKKSVLRFGHQAGTSGPLELHIEDATHNGVQQPVGVLGLNVGPGRVAGRAGVGLWVEGNYFDGARTLTEAYFQHLATAGAGHRSFQSEFNVGTGSLADTILSGANVSFKSAAQELLCNFSRNNFTLSAPEASVVNEFNLKAHASNAAKLRIGNLGTDGVLEFFVDKDYGYATLQRSLLGATVPGAGDLRHLMDVNNVVAGGVTRFYGTAGEVFRTKATFGTDVLTTDVLATFAPPSVGHTADQAAYLIPGTSTVAGAVLAGGTWLSDLATKGIVLKDAAATPHYWRVTVTTAGVLTTTDLGTTRPTS